MITDTSIVQMLEESLTSPSGCLFPYRNPSSGETDFDGMWTVLTLYWIAVRDTFPDAWGKPPTQSRLMHGAGIRAMGRLMDRMMAAIDPGHDDAADADAVPNLALVAPYCRWTDGRWDGLDLRWNEVQNVPRHIGPNCPVSSSAPTCRPRPPGDEVLLPRQPGPDRSRLRLRHRGAPSPARPAAR